MVTATVLAEPARQSYYVLGTHFRGTLERIGVSVAERPLPLSAPERAATARACAGQVVFHNTIGPLFEPLDGCVNVALPLHEWSRYPAPWIERLNRFEAVWTSSRFVMRVLRDSGLLAPVSFVPPALDLAPLPAKASWRSDGPFRFLACGEAHFRKGFHLLIPAFLDAFPRLGQATLTVKTGPGCEWESPRADIRIVARKLSRASLVSLYRTFDAYVSTSLGEGLDLPVAEAVLAGLPVVTHRWSGHADLLAPGGYFGFRYRLIDQPFASQPSYYAAGQRCAFSDPADIAAALGRAVRATPRARRGMASAARSHLLEVFGADPAVERMRRAWNRLLRAA